MMYFKSSTCMVLNLLLPMKLVLNSLSLTCLLSIKRDVMTSIPYAQAIGNLLLLAINTRLDLAHPIHHLA
jgi:hypothetical protein